MSDNQKQPEDAASWLTLQATEAIRTVLLDAGLLASDQTIDEVTVAGQGNMNLTASGSI